MRVTLLALLCLLSTQLARAQSFPSIRASLEHWEGVRATPYADPLKGDSVVGIGHNLTAHKEVPKQKYTPSEVTQLYATDLRAALRTARQGVDNFDGLPEQVKHVIVNIIWTTGSKGYSRFVHLNRALSKRQYSLAARHLEDSLWVGQVSAARATWAISVVKSAK